MKKSLLLIPSLVAITVTPFISLTSCFESEEDDPTPPTPVEHKVKIDPDSDTNDISISAPTITLNKDLVIDYGLVKKNKQIDFDNSWISIYSYKLYLDDGEDYYDEAINYLYFDDSKMMIPSDLVTTYNITICLKSMDKQVNKMTVTFEGYDSIPNLSYSTNEGKTWTQVKQSGVITLEGNHLWLKGDNAQGLSNVSCQTSIELEGDITLEGNVMDLIDNNIETNDIDAVPCEFCFYKLFEGSTGLKSITKNYLSPKVLTRSCYEYMFANCTWLTSLPESLFASEELAFDCFWDMFDGCKRLFELPNNIFSTINKIESYSFEYMFENCIWLTKLPNNLLPFTKLADYCYCSMFDNCYRLTQLPNTLFPSNVQLAPYCCTWMFSNCGFSSIPENFLPTTELAEGCYDHMFWSCDTLTSLSKNLLPADVLPNACYKNMFAFCGSLKIREGGESDPDKKIFTCPSSIGENACEGMFVETGGYFRDTPTSGKTYYWYE